MKKDGIIVLILCAGIIANRRGVILTVFFAIIHMIIVCLYIAGAGIMTSIKNWYYMSPLAYGVVFLGIIAALRHIAGKDRG